MAVILRRGPTRWVELILWDTKKDLFQRGQWFHGRVYEERCDLSPDGTKFIYFAAKYGGKRDADMPGTWTAISKPPYFTALALWPGIGAWGGGGRFLDNQCLWHADCNPIHPRFSLKGLVEVPDKVAAVSFDDKFRNDRLYLRLRQVGWEVVEQKGRRLLKWRRANPVGRGELLLDRSFSAARYYLAGANRSEPLAFDAEWADWDQKGRLILANRGKVLLMDARTDRLNRVPREELDVHLKPQHITCTAILRIPVTRDLGGVYLVQNRVEERLIG